MSELFATTRIVDLILGLMVLEGLCLGVFYFKTARGITPPDLLCTLLAGGFLVLALRGVLLRLSWGWIALSLAAALVAHLADLFRRWRR